LHKFETTKNSSKDKKKKKKRRRRRRREKVDTYKGNNSNKSISSTKGEKDAILPLS